MHTAAASGFSVLYDITEKDRIYTALPLYHSAGGTAVRPAIVLDHLCHGTHARGPPPCAYARPGMIGVGMMFYSGAALVLRRKFSAKQFIPDIRENNCTVFQVCSRSRAHARRVAHGGTD